MHRPETDVAIVSFMSTHGGDKHAHNIDYVKSNLCYVDAHTLQADFADDILRV